MKRIDFQPVLFDTLKNYSKEKFFTDLMAGIIVGIVALPLAIAFGIASGVSPEQGLITAIIAGFIVSFLGGSTDRRTDWGLYRYRLWYYSTIRYRGSGDRYRYGRNHVGLDGSI